MLDPFVEPEAAGDPAFHVRYGDGGPGTVPGQIRGTSERGRATVATCGLDRPSLVDARARLARHVADLIAEFYGERGADADRRKALDLLLGLGADGQTFAGMVRAMARFEFDIPWQQLEQLAGR